MNGTNETIDRISNDVTGSDLEESLFGTWFARLGALVFLIGAGFAFSYAIDRGWIGPLGRVLVGAAIGIVFVVGGHRARSAGWSAFSQAVTAGGIAVMYLSVLAAMALYDLVSPLVGFGLLSAVAILGALLAAAYRSYALALLSTIGAFVNLGLMSVERVEPDSIYAYLVGLDLGLVVLAWFQRWPSLERIALWGTAVFFLYELPNVDATSGLLFATVLWALFSAVPFAAMRRAGTKDRLGGLDVTISATTLYLAAGLYFVDALPGDREGLFTFLMSVATAGLAVVAARLRQAPLAWTYAGASLVLLTITAPIAFDDRSVHLMWAAQATALFFVGERTRWERPRVAGVALVALALAAATFDLSSNYTPGRAFFTPAGLSFMTEIALLYGCAYLLSRMSDDWRLIAYPAAGLAATALTTAWLTRETVELVNRAMDLNATFEATQFGISSAWALHASVVLAAGLTLKLRWARLYALVLFIVVLAKLVSLDVWLMSTGYRTIAFIGLGALLLVGSLLYNRARGRRE